MFRFLLDKLKFLKAFTAAKSSNGEPRDEALEKSLSRNTAKLKEILGESPDIIYRTVTISHQALTARALLIFIDGLTDKTVINENILKPLMTDLEPDPKTKGADARGMLGMIRDKILFVGGVEQNKALPDLVDAVLSGDSVLLVDGMKEALIISTRGWEKRSLTEPESEVIVKGPRSGFVETMRTNTALLRRIVKDPGLTLDVVRVGRRTKTDVCIAYIKGIIRESLVDEIKRRLRGIDTDAVLAAGFIEQFIEDEPLSIFPTMGFTERPDVTASRILEGRAAIFVDGTPVVNIVPTLLVENFQSPDDYNFRPIYATMFRWFRYIAFVLSFIAPAIYVAVTNYHQEIIPTPLLITMAAATEGTPVPAVVEVIGMGFIFEVLREAGVRIPRPLGQAVSIMGALVISQATVAAGLVGAPVVILTAFTAIAAFTVPKLIEVGAILRFTLTLLAGFLGGYGILAGLIFTFIHLASLRSFGVSYLAPVLPFIPADLKDVAVRAPLWTMLTRPAALRTPDPQRQDFDLMVNKEE